jgi:ubiquinone/menaquinone biosynthesis C-methylase UbiE
MSDELNALQSAEDSHWWFASRTRALLGLLDRELGENNLRVLDVGCGAGNMILHLSRYGSVVGIDNNPVPLEIAHQRGYDARLAHAEDMPFEDESFDLVTTLDVIEHCDDDLRILRECHRVCANGGLVAITVPAFQWLWSHNDVINDHKRRYSRPELRAKLTQAGFHVRRVTYNNCFIFPVAAPLIMARRRVEREPELATPSTKQGAYQVEMEPTSPPINAILGGIGRLEAAVLGATDLPFGTSIICIASKGTQATDREAQPARRAHGPQPEHTRPSEGE